MANKPGFVPEVDIVKSGIERVDPLADKRDDDGYVRVSRTKSGIESRNKAITREITEQEEKMRHLKEIAGGYGLSKKDIKEVQEDIEEDDLEKEEKKKKKNKLMDPYFASLISSGDMPSDFADYIKDGGEKGKKNKKKKKKKKEKERAQLEGFKVKEKDKKDKKKDKDHDGKDGDKDAKERSEVADRFREVEKISRKNISEVDDTIDFINARLDEIKEGGERMKSKDYIISNYLSTKASLISTKQKIATDIGANRKMIYEIEMKKEKSAKDASASDSDMIARLFPGIVLNGNSGDMAKYVAESGKNKDSKKKKKKKYWEDYEDDMPDDDDLERRERDLVDSGDIDYSKYDKNIEWEGKFKVAIKKSYQTDEWKFVGMDSDGNFIDVPKSHLPSKKAAQMVFDDEKDIARDKSTNICYQVFQVPRL